MRPLSTSLACGRAGGHACLPTSPLSRRTRLLILDEVDQLLAPQFREEMVRLCEHTGKKAPGPGRQTLVVSATLTPKVLAMCAPWCPNPRLAFVGATPAGSGDGEAAPAAAAPAGAAADAAPAGRQQGQEGELAEVERAERRPSWGWGDAKSPSADAADYNPGTSSAGGLGSEGGAAASMPPHLRHHYVASAPQVRTPPRRRGSIRCCSIDRGQLRGRAHARTAARRPAPACLSARAAGAQHLLTSAADERHPVPHPTPYPQHKVDTLRRSIHALGAQRALVFMNFQQRLKDTGERRNRFWESKRSDGLVAAEVTRHG